MSMIKALHPNVFNMLFLKSDEFVMSSICLWLELENISIFSMQEILSFERLQEETYFSRPPGFADSIC